MAIGSFVNGVFKGMDMREKREDRKTERSRNETRWENEETDMGRNGRRWEMEQEKHDAAMRASRRAGRPSVASIRQSLIADALSGAGGDASGGAYPDSQPTAAGGGGTGFSALQATGNAGALNFGESVPSAQTGAVPPPPAPPAPQPAPKPIEMSALPASAGATQPTRYIYTPGQGMIPQGVA